MTPRHCTKHHNERQAAILIEIIPEFEEFTNNP